MRSRSSSASFPSPRLQPHLEGANRLHRLEHAATLELGNPEARDELFRRLQLMGISRALERLGVAGGERVRIGVVEVAWEA